MLMLADTDAGTALGGLVVWLMIGIMYFLPTIIANNRKHRSVMAVAVLNLLLGWTGLGWIAALVWSLANTGEPVVVQQIIQQPPQP